MRIPSGSTAYRGNRGRAIWAGQYAPSRAAWIDNVNLSTTGNTVDFGDIGGSWWSMSGTSNGHGGLG